MTSKFLILTSIYIWPKHCSGILTCGKQHGKVLALYDLPETLWKKLGVDSKGRLIFAIAFTSLIAYGAIVSCVSTEFFHQITAMQLVLYHVMTSFNSIPFIFCNILDNHGHTNNERLCINQIKLAIFDICFNFRFHKIVILQNLNTTNWFFAGLCISAASW